MREHSGQEVMFTLPKLKKEAATWFASDLAPVFGPDGVGCPPELFVELFTARFIAPHLKSHAFEGVDGIRQDKLDAKAYTEKFNEALAKLALSPGHPGLSAKEHTDKYLKGLQPHLRTTVFRNVPQADTQPLYLLQWATLQADEVNKSLSRFNESAKHAKASATAASSPPAKADDKQNAPAKGKDKDSRTPAGKKAKQNASTQGGSKRDRDSNVRKDTERSHSPAPKRSEPVPGGHLPDSLYGMLTREQRDRWRSMRHSSQDDREHSRPAAAAAAADVRAPCFT